MRSAAATIGLACLLAACHEPEAERASAPAPAPEPAEPTAAPEPTPTPPSAPEVRAEPEPAPALDEPALAHIEPELIVPEEPQAPAD
ncbi:MAG: hypothetical protein KC501_42085, partial [Myxococcales bacterium]|nr:hypothetical protein [Myxococcales bacterium]